MGALDVDYRDTEGKPKEACGVFGLYSRELSGELAQRTYFGLYALQHRGQESAGIAVSDGERTTAMRDMGLVSQVFDGPRLAALDLADAERSEAVRVAESDELVAEDHGHRVSTFESAHRAPDRLPDREPPLQPPPGRRRYVGRVRGR